MLVAAVASLDVVVTALVQSRSQRNATAVASVLLSVVSVALGHALFSYTFGTGVLAVAINLVTSLGQ